MEQFIQNSLFLWLTEGELIDSYLETSRRIFAEEATARDQRDWKHAPRRTEHLNLFLDRQASAPYNKSYDNYAVH
jgi:hypothetical protein